MTETENKDGKVRLRTHRSKRIHWREDGSVEMAQWIMHREGFSVEFHISDQPASLDWPCREMEVEGIGKMRISDCPGGIEVHRRKPATYEAADRPADHGHCSVLGAPCWHDGTSLGASEFAETWHGDDASVWGLLERWCGYEERDR